MGGIEFSASLESSSPRSNSALRKALARSENLTPLLTKFGKYMVPGAIHQHWPTAPLTTRYGSREIPLIDTGRLRDSITAVPSASDLLIKTNVPHARILQEGGVIRATSAKWLTIPMFPGLSISEIRSHRPARTYKNTFVLMNGPEGPGIYRRSGRKGDLHMIFRFVKMVKIPKRPFLFFSLKDRAMFSKMAKGYFSQ